MSEKQMTLGELVRWLDNNDVPYGIDDAGKLTVKGDLREDFRSWVKTREYTNLPDELVCVKGDLWLEDTLITSLGNLTSVGGFLDLGNTPITSLGNLTSVGGWLDLQYTPLTSLGNLTSVGGYLNLRGTPVTSLSNLISVRRSLVLQGASITSLNDLPQVGGDLHLDQHQLRLLTKEALQKVTGRIEYWDQMRDDQVVLSPAELEAIVVENEQREKLNNTRESDVDWDLYDR